MVISGTGTSGGQHLQMWPAYLNLRGSPHRFQVHSIRSYDLIELVMSADSFVSSKMERSHHVYTM